MEQSYCTFFKQGKGVVGPVFWWYSVSALSQSSTVRVCYSPVLTFLLACSSSCSSATGDSKIVLAHLHCAEQRVNSLSSKSKANKSSSYLEQASHFPPHYFPRNCHFHHLTNHQMPLLCLSPDLLPSPCRFRVGHACEAL